MSAGSMTGPILVLGRNGQVGWELQRALGVLAPLVAVARAECDLADTEAVRRLVRQTAPRAIVNAAAYTAVDKAEAEPAAAHAINAGLPAVLAEEARALDAWLVHYSTDYVFKGDKPGAYAEDDPTDPQSVYGRSKLAGEQAARAWSRHLVLRTSWVFGAHGGNFLKTMLRLGRERSELKVVDDQHGAPTSAALIADVTAHALAAVLRGQGAAGVYHLASAGDTTWCGYARYVMEQALALGVPLACRPQAVHPIATSDYPLPAARPANSRLNTARLRATFGLHLPPWQEQVTRVLQTILKENHA
mgnify:CR=1 FL=1